MNFVQVFKIFMLFSLGAFINACVSVQLGQNEIKKSTDYKYKAPEKPWQEISSLRIDHGWKNTRNGNSLSVVSDCSEQQDPTLNSIREGVLTGIDEVELLSEKKTMFNQREALQTEAKGKVDGVPTLMNVLLFKKNGCIFILTYVGTQIHYASNTETFDAFLKHFEVP